MKKPVVIFLLCVVASIIALLFYTFKGDGVTEEPIRIPSRTEIVPPGTASQDLVQTSDEHRIPELLRPTPLVRKSTDKLLAASCDGGTDRCKLQAIYDFVRTNYEYTEVSVQHTYIQAPDQTLIYGTGDGLELALLLGSMQRAAGFQNEILIGPYHTFVRTHYGNESMVIDPSCQGCRFMAASVSLSGNERVYS